MITTKFPDTGFDELVRSLSDRGEPYAIATVIRTMGLTAAKPGAKAVLNHEGTIIEGWIGGGCVRSAMTKATLRAIDEGAPQLISLAPAEVLADLEIEAGAEVNGIRYAKNGCPSKGSLDIFIEPVVPMPELLVFGTSPVARALAALAERFNWSVQTPDADDTIHPLATGARRMVVVATQGKDDLAALKSALQTQSEHIGFVASRKKWAALSNKLAEAGFDETALSRVQAPAGLAIDAVTPDEIALSILAQLTQIRRRKQRKDSADA
ncbi:XdhC family protein [Marivivens sp. LCG002]|uniref:XdhC family protein n=1 Tax=Marivivens sp. LCG002 TaxID=3051171 RepID=UPI0025568AD8|nr:XdhC family protein [Marivivens sp. LCG002]WIV51188.1 XdhC family protein [Marivivens sp. LCG002]